MRGRMMDFPLTMNHFARRAASLFPTSEVVSRRGDGSIHRTMLSPVLARARRLASALEALGVAPGDRVATLQWNHERHLEAYVGVPCMGAVLHTLNLRLSPADLAYIASHADDKVLLVDECLLPLARQFVEEVKSLQTIVVLRETGAPLAAGALDYEALLADARKGYTYPENEESQAAFLCYTSGTTGRPKGVLYSHRSIALHALAQSMVDTLGIANADVLMPVVPMFHACAWGLPYAALTNGTKLVLPGPQPDAPALLDLITRERVTVAAGVPTVWLSVLATLDEAAGSYDVSSIRSLLVGGAAAPPSLITGFEERHHVAVLHSWGMTEMSPIGTLAHVKSHLAEGSKEAALGYRASQGYPIPLVEQRHVDDRARVLPWDGQTVGELEVRGPWVASSYMGGEGPDRFTTDGWFKTGDVVTIDPEGYVRITDRAKDVIKSGGEWISSVDLENAIMSHPAVLEAAVFAARHPKWDERPVAAVVLKKGHAASEAELATFLEPRFAKWWLPDAWLFIDQVPRTSTGKFLKTRLRDLYGDVLMPGR